MIIINGKATGRSERPFFFFSFLLSVCVLPGRKHKPTKIRGSPKESTIKWKQTHTEPTNQKKQKKKKKNESQRQPRNITRNPVTDKTKMTKEPSEAHERGPLPSKESSSRAATTWKKRRRRRRRKRVPCFNRPSTANKPASPFSFLFFRAVSSSFFFFFFFFFFGIRRPLFMLPTSSLPLLPFLLLLLLFFKGASHLGRHFYFSLQKTKKILKKNEDMKWNYSLNSTRAAVRFPFDERLPPQLTSWLVGQSPRRFRLYRRLLKSGRSNQFEFELERHRVCPHQNDLEISNRFQNNKLPLINQKISWPITASLSVIPKIA